jgi:hypothetical protein
VTQHLLRRCAVHESGHATAALHYSLPILKVTIHSDGGGKTEYARRLGSGEVEVWTAVSYAGPMAELDAFGDASEDGDLKAIKTMVADLNLGWAQNRYDEFRRRARALMARERSSIRAVADELTRRRSLSGDEVAALVPTAASSRLWVA